MQPTIKTTKKFHPNGRLWNITHYVDGKPHGTEKDYDSKGRLTAVTEWENGAIVDSRYVR